MDRRFLLKNLFLLSAGTSLPAFVRARTNTPALRRRASAHSFKLGALEMTVVTDGALHMTPVQPNWAFGVPASTVDSLLSEKFRSIKEVVLGLNILVIRSGKRCILVDSGCGTGFGSGAGWLPASLHAAGISPAEVTDVVITHAHPDHIGGLLQADRSLAFPAADIHISNIEHKFWLQDAFTLQTSSTPMHCNSHIRIGIFTPTPILRKPLLPAKRS